MRVSVELLLFFLLSLDGPKAHAKPALAALAPMALQAAGPLMASMGGGGGGAPPAPAGPPPLPFGAGGAPPGGPQPGMTPGGGPPGAAKQKKPKSAKGP